MACLPQGMQQSTSVAILRQAVSSSQLLLRCSRPIENGGYSNEQGVSWSSEKIAVMSTIYQQRLGVSVGKPD